MGLLEKYENHMKGVLESNTTPEEIMFFELKPTIEQVMTVNRIIKKKQNMAFIYFLIDAVAGSWIMAFTTLMVLLS